MAKQFNGKVSLDIRDSTPDWEPFLAPQAEEGAPNVLFLAWDDVGYGTMDVFGGPVQTPNMRRIADMGVRYANFHTTALCSPTRSSLLTGRNATANGMATIAEFGSGFPGISARDPVRERLHLRGARRARLQHLLRRQVASDTRRGSDDGRRTRAAGRSGAVSSASTASCGGETNSWYPDLVHDNHSDRRAGDSPRRATTSPRTCRTRRSSSSSDAKVVDPDKPFFMYLSSQCAHAPHHVFEGVGGQVQGSLRPGLRGDAGRDPGTSRRTSACCRPIPSCRRSTRTASRRPPARMGSPGRCWTPCVRGTR